MLAHLSDLIKDHHEVITRRIVSKYLQDGLSDETLIHILHQVRDNQKAIMFQLEQIERVAT